MNQCKDMHQGLTFSGVYSHRQIGWMEWRIRSLQELARYHIIHSHHLWPSAMADNLQPYVIFHAAIIINENTSCYLNYTSTPLHMFSKSKVDSNPSHWQPIFWPVYALSCPLALDQNFDKWKDKITLGVYLGMYPIHVSTLALVIILSTRRVSPQFHVAFYTSFSTINGSGGDIVPSR